PPIRTVTLTALITEILRPYRRPSYGRVARTVGGRTHDGEGEDQGEYRHRGQQQQTEHVRVRAPVDVAHQQRWHKSAQTAGRADEPGDAADARWFCRLRDQRENRTAAGAQSRGHR